MDLGETKLELVGRSRAVWKVCHGKQLCVEKVFFFIYVPARIWKKSTSGSVGRLITLKRKPDVLQMERG